MSANRSNLLNLIRGLCKLIVPVPLYQDRVSWGFPGPHRVSAVVGSLGCPDERSAAWSAPGRAPRSPPPFAPGPSPAPLPAAPPAAAAPQELSFKKISNVTPTALLNHVNKKCLKKNSVTAIVFQYIYIFFF